MKGVAPRLAHSLFYFPELRATYLENGLGADDLYPLLVIQDADSTPRRAHVSGEMMMRRIGYVNMTCEPLGILNVGQAAHPKGNRPDERKPERRGLN